MVEPLSEEEIRAKRCRKLFELVEITKFLQCKDLIYNSASKIAISSI